MILSTLPDIPGRTYDVIGVVFGKASPFSIGGGNSLEKMFQSMFQQASGMGADAIVDIKMTGAGEYLSVVAIGTAVKLR